MRSMWIRGALVVGAGCGGPAAPPPAPPVNLAADAEDDPGLAPDDDPDDGMDCQVTSSHLGAFLEPDVPAEVSLIECQGEPIAPHGEEAAAQGFTETPMSASLRVAVAGATVAEHELASWTNGWEWGGRWGLAGVLRGGAGETDAVVLSAGSWSEGGSADQVQVVSLAGGSLLDLWSVDGRDARVTFAKDGTSFEVALHDDPDGDPWTPTRTIRMSFSGGVVHEVDDD